ncbi:MULTISPECIES: hypothetical protein [Exiguobacterium]|uniref:hypothetical protein n=1 Tax=Exiguobacterium TaxID=33986 RepID=UPI001BE9E65A|nr:MULTISPECIES: hypothetical protein [Exiguobacterium]MCT4782718.1 hypothetical protein [Exiguobacterium himgiriensis]
MIEIVLSFGGFGLMIGGALFCFISIYRYFIKKDVTPFPIILGGSFILVGVWLVFLLGIIERNNQELVTDSNQGSAITVPNEASEQEDTEVDEIENESVNEKEEADATKASIEEFMQEVKVGDPTSSYKDYMEEHGLKTSRGYNVYNRKIDEVTIENRNIVIVYNNNLIIEVETEKNINQLKDEQIKKYQDELTTTISGSTDAGTDAISLKEGFAVVESTYDGSGNFAVVLQDAQGNMLDLLVNEIGSYKGKSFIWIKETEDYYLNINGNQGNWDIKIMQYRPLEIETLPGILEGNGDDVIFFEINQGSYQIAFTHNGDSNFAVTVNAIDLLVNEIGNYEGSQRYSFEDTSVYVFVVKADGDWTITVKE